MAVTSPDSGACVRGLVFPGEFPPNVCTAEAKGAGRAPPLPLGFLTKPGDLGRGGKSPDREKWGVSEVRVGF